MATSIKRKILAIAVSMATVLGGVSLTAAPAEAATSKCWNIAKYNSTYQLYETIITAPNPCRANRDPEKAVWETFRVYQVTVRTYLRFALAADTPAKQQLYDGRMRTALVRLMMMAGYTVPRIGNRRANYNAYVAEIANGRAVSVASSEHIMRVVQYHLAYVIGQVGKIDGMYDVAEFITGEAYSKILEGLKIDEPSEMDIYGDFLSHTRDVAKAVLKLDAVTPFVNNINKAINGV